MNNEPQVWFFSYLDLDEPEAFLVMDSFEKLLESLSLFGKVDSKVATRKDGDGSSNPQPDKY